MMITGLTGQKLGPYVLQGILAHGGHSITYEARNNFLDGLFAVKLFHPDVLDQLVSIEDDPHADALARCRRDSDLAAALRHPNIVRILEWSRAEALPLVYLVAERNPGDDLGVRIRRKGRLSPMLVRELGMRLGAIIGACHKLGIAHRGLSPRNVLVTRGPRGEELIKLRDFGVAHLPLRPGAIHDVAPYVAPELSGAVAAGTVGEASVDDTRADQFALGAILFEALTGRPPPAHDEIALVEAPPPPPLRTLCPEAPPFLAHAIERALSPIPNERFATMEDLTRALDNRAPGVRMSGSPLAPGFARTGVTGQSGGALSFDSVQRSGPLSFDSTQRSGAPSFDSAQRSGASFAAGRRAPVAEELPPLFSRSAKSALMLPDVDALELEGPQRSGGTLELEAIDILENPELAAALAVARRAHSQQTVVPQGLADELPGGIELPGLDGGDGADDYATVVAEAEAAVSGASVKGAAARASGRAGLHLPSLELELESSAGAESSGVTEPAAPLAMAPMAPMSVIPSAGTRARAAARPAGGAATDARRTRDIAERPALSQRSAWEPTPGWPPVVEPETVPSGLSASSSSSSQSRGGEPSALSPASALSQSLRASLREAAEARSRQTLGLQGTDRARMRSTDRQSDDRQRPTAAAVSQSLRGVAQSPALLSSAVARSEAERRSSTSRGSEERLRPASGQTPSGVGASQRLSASALSQSSRGASALSQSSRGASAQSSGMSLSQAAGQRYGGGRRRGGQAAAAVAGVSLLIIIMGGLYLLNGVRVQPPITDEPGAASVAAAAPSSAAPAPAQPAPSPVAPIDSAQRSGAPSIDVHVDPQVLLDQAEQALAQNAPRRAIDLSRQALPSLRAWRIIAVAACQVGDASLLRHAEAQLSDLERRDVQRACQAKAP